MSFERLNSTVLRKLWPGSKRTNCGFAASAKKKVCCLSRDVDLERLRLAVGREVDVDRQPEQSSFSSCVCVTVSFACFAASSHS